MTNSITITFAMVMMPSTNELSLIPRQSNAVTINTRIAAQGSSGVSNHLTCICVRKKGSFSWPPKNRA
jgi:hypothetical protein